MKLGQLVNPAFQAAFRKLSTQDVPLRAAYAIKGIEKQIREELSKYDAARVDSLKKLGTLDEKGELELDEHKNVKLSDEAMKSFAEQLSSLGEVDIAVSAIKISDLGNNVKLSASEASLLEDILSE